MNFLLYAFAWFVFALSHSLLARPWLQQKLENVLGRSYRFAYNVFALACIALVMFLGTVWLDGSRYAIFNNNVIQVAGALARYLGFLILAVAVLQYDIGRFAGITQLFTGELVSSSTNEPLQQKGLNKWVRHPLYTGAFLILWSGAVSQLGLWTAIWGTAYLIIGTHFEERKLVRVYGEPYRLYQRDVPRYFPFSLRRRAQAH